MAAPEPSALLAALLGAQGAEPDVARLRDHQGVLGAALAAISDPLLAVDHLGRLLMATRRAREALGLPIAAPWEAAELPPALAEALMARLERAARGEDAVGVIPVELGEGARRTRLLMRGSVVRARDGRLIGLVAHLRDADRAHLDDEVRYDLVSTVAHELRTPLTSLHMSIHLCLEQSAGPLSDEQGILLSSAREDCERLRLLADELLDMGRLASGRVALDLEAVPAQDLARRAWSSFRPLAEAKGVRLEYEVEESLPAVLADRERVQRVFTNLLSNALRHTPQGGLVAISASVDERAVRFTVADTGEGIPAEYIGQVFEKFVRGPGRPHQGYGLGLCIARDIIAAHGGHIEVASEPGRGATFHFALARAGLSGRLTRPGA